MIHLQETKFNRQFLLNMANKIKKNQNVFIEWMKSEWASYNLIQAQEIWSCPPQTPTSRFTPRNFSC